MSNKNVTLDLKARKDKDGMIYYIAKIKAPIMIDCSQGVVFLIFTSDLNDEQLQIAPMDNKDNKDLDD